MYESVICAKRSTRWATARNTSKSCPTSASATSTKANTNRKQ